MKALSRQLIRVTKLTLNAFRSVPNGEVPDRTGKGEMQVGICHFDPDESCSMQCDQVPPAQDTFHALLWWTLSQQMKVKI